MLADIDYRKLHMNNNNQKDGYNTQLYNIYLAYYYFEVLSYAQIYNIPVLAIISAIVKIQLILLSLLNTFHLFYITRTVTDKGEGKSSARRQVPNVMQLETWLFMFPSSAEQQCFK